VLRPNLPQKREVPRWRHPHGLTLGRESGSLTGADPLAPESSHMNRVALSTL